MFRQINSVNFINFSQFLRVILPPAVKDESPCIICFKVKNPPTEHSTSKIQPTRSPTFVFSVSASVRKKWGYERKLLRVVSGVVHSVFLFSFYYFTQKV
jgi:hypothetical protein